MRRRPRDLTGLRWAPAVLTVALLTAPVAALAYWTAHGSGTATGSVGTLAAPSISNAKPGAGTVELNWTTVTPPGPGEVTYYVSRDGGAASGACPSSSSPSSETSCTDTGVSLGTHHYTVTAVWRSWTATSTSTSVEVTFGPATHLLLTPASTTPTAGTGDALTITAQDASNNTVATYTGEKSLAFGGASVIGPHGPTVSSATGSAIAMGTHEPISFSGGVATVSGTSNGVMTLYKAETASITVTDGSIGNGSGVSVMVKPATANSFSVPTPPAQTAGKAFEETLTAKDEYGNLATGYAGSKAIAFSGPSNSPSGEKPKYPSTVSFSEGAGKATITLYKAEATTLTAKEGPISGTSGSFTVNANSTTAQFDIATPATQTSGKAFEVTLTADDTYGNTATAFAGPKAITFSGPSESPSKTKPAYPSSVTFSEGAGKATITLYKAEATTLTAKEGPISGTSGSFTVSPAGAAGFSLPIPATQTAGKAFEETLTAKDEYGNLATGYAGSKAIAFSGPSNSPSGEKPKYPSTVSFSEGAGKATITLYKAEATTLTAKEGPISGTSGSFTVNAGTAEKLAWTSPKSSNGSAEGLCLFTCTWNGIGKGNSWTTQVGVADAGGNVVSELGGSHKVTFSATEGTAPKEVTVPATGPAVTTAVEYKSPTPTGWTTATLTAKSLGFSDATVTFNK